MNEQHYKEQLSAFVNHELPTSNRQLIAGHLLVCADCRAAHDDIKFAVALAEKLPQSDAPTYLWNQIESAIDSERPAVTQTFALFNLRTVSAALLLLIAVGLAAFVRFGTPDVAGNGALAEEEVKPTGTVNETTAAVNAPGVVPVESPSPVMAIPPLTAGKKEVESATAPIAGIPVQTSTAPRTRSRNSSTKIPTASWDVETLSGKPRIGDSSKSAKLAVGEVLETDANSRARVIVADIGNVEIAPNSRVKLVTTKSTEHRLSLERGLLRAKIFAPPRLFIVDTPTATAFDLGCEYTLEVDENGDSRLHVTGGFVALENGRFESIVPAGASAQTRKGKGIGMPFSDGATDNLKKAVYEFDFNNGGAAAVDEIITEASKADSITLWHLISRVDGAERETVIAALSSRVDKPTDVTFEGVMKLDRKMLERWWAEIENVWFDLKSEP